MEQLEWSSLVEQFFVNRNDNIILESEHKNDIADFGRKKLHHSTPLQWLRTALIHSYIIYW